MAKVNKTYDEAIQRIKRLVAELEQSEALSLDEYQKKAQEANELLAYCEVQLGLLEKAINHILE